MGLEIPITIANVIAVTYAERGSGGVPAYTDAIKTFIFVGEPSEAEREDVLQYAFELTQECTDQLSEEEISEFLFNATAFDHKRVEFKDGNVSVHWETRL